VIKKAMLTGILTISLNPPYLTFQEQSAEACTLKSCSVDDIRQALIELADVEPSQWPPEDFVMRMPGQFKRATLARFGLATRLLRTLPTRTITQIAN